MHLAAAISEPKAVFTNYGSGIRGSLSGAVTGSIGACAFFIESRDNGGTTVTRSLLGNTYISFGITGLEYLTITIQNGGSVLSAVSASFQLLAANSENHIVVEWDTNAAAGSKKLKAYVDEAEITLTTTDVSAAFTLPYAALGNLTLFEQASFAVREFMLWANSIPVFPSELATLRKTSGEPGDVGERGQYLSARPDIYLSLRGGAGAKAFAANRGKAGGTWTFLSGTTPYHDYRRLIGYGDSNMTGNGAATPYTSKLGDLFPLKLAVVNHGVANAPLTSIRDYILNGGPRGMPSISYIKANWPDTIFVLEGGGNSLPTDGTGGVTASTLISYWGQIVSAVTDVLPDARFIVQGISTRVSSEAGTYKRTVLDGVNETLAATHGARYFDVDNYLRSDQAFADAGLTKTAQDITDLGNQIIPTAFRQDGSHLNQAAHNLLLPRAFALMESLGYA